MKGTTLFLTRDFPPLSGGIARLYSELCLRFPTGAVEVSTVAAPPAHPEARVAGTIVPRRSGREDWPFPVHRMAFDYRAAKSFASVLRWRRWTARRLAEGDVALIHAGDFRPAGYVAAWARRRSGVPYVLYVHGTDIWKERQRAHRSLRSRWTAQRILGGASAVIANSRATAAATQALIAALDLRTPPPVRVVNPGTNPERFRPDAPGAEEWRRAWGAGSELVVLTVARLVEHKGVDTAMRAFAAQDGRAAAPLMVIGGTGPELERLRRLAGELGVADRVRFVGAVAEDRLPGLYAAADVFLLPTREERGEEGFGIVFCEASASGVPVVAGASQGVPDAVRDGETGILVPALDQEAVTAGLGRLLRDEELRRRMGAAGRRAAETYYNWERAATEAWSVVEEAARS